MRRCTPGAEFEPFGEDAHAAVRQARSLSFFGLTCFLLWLSASASEGATPEDPAIAIQQGHLDQVSSVAFACNNQQLISASFDGTIRIWQVTSGKLVRILRGRRNASGPLPIAVSPDGNLLAARIVDGEVGVWDLSSGRQVGVCNYPYGHLLVFAPNGETLAIGSGVAVHLCSWRQPGSDRRVDLDRTLRDLSFSSDGSELATGTTDDIVELWNVETGADLRPLQGHTDAILALAFSPTENLIATGSKDRTARLWDLATGAARTVTTESSAIVDLSFSGDGRRLLTRNADGKISVWNTKTGEPSGTLASSSRATVPSLTPNGRFIAVVDQHSVVTLDLDSNQKRLIPLTGSPSIAVAFDSTSSLAAIGDGAVPVIWDLATGTPKVRLGRKTMRPSSLGLSDDGIEAVAADDHVVTTWNVHTGAIRNLSSAVAIPAGTLLALSPDRSILAIHADVSIRDRVTTFLSTDDGHKLLSLEDAAGPPVLFSRTGRYFADIDRSGRLAVRTLDGTSVLDLSPPAGAISRLAFSDDDTSVALLETEGQIHVWRLPSARPSRQIRSQAKGTSLRFVSPSVLVKVQGGDPVESWNVETGMKMPAHPPTVPLERRELAALGTDNGIEIFDLDRSRYVRHLSLAGFSSIVAAQWSAKAGLLATASEDGEVTIWKEINGMAQRICGLYLYADGTAVVLTPEGSRLPDHRCVLPDDALNGGKDHHD